MSKKLSKESRYRQLFDIWKSGEYACLVIQARRFLDEFPNHFVGWTLYGVGLYEIARYDDSRKALLTSMKIRQNKSLRFVYNQMGNLFREKGEYQTAARWY